MRFTAIDGLRGWLAWAVVTAHIVLFCNLEMNSKLGVAVSNLGFPAVQVFIVISGFVICGLIVESREPWWPYITRRFFRIFPLYWFLLPITVFLMPYAADATPFMPWANEPQGTELRYRDYADAISANPFSQWLLHITLFHGVIPDSLWWGTSINMLGPAWSLSLEWQFYLVAPIFVWLLTSRKWVPLTVGVVMLCGLFFSRQILAQYDFPSILPAAAYLFMIGIGSRLGFKHLQTIELPSVLIIGILLFSLQFREIRWLAIWLSVLIYLLNETRWKDEFVAHAMKLALESEPALYFGQRSYSTYLVHFPVMYLLLISLAPLGLSRETTIVAFSISSIILTAAASHLLYRFIEQPFIRLGSRLARKQIAISAN